ncbi:MAG: hypothetical protein ACI4VF_08360, partial [Lachnospirales bacterium]
NHRRPKIMAKKEVYKVKPMTEGKRNIISREFSMNFIGHTKARPGREMHLVDDYLDIDDN